MRSAFLPQVDLAIENVALRQQVAALKKENPRPPIDPLRPRILGLASPVVAPLEGSAHHRQARDRGGLAP
jgi:hypothetical protein